LALEWDRRRRLDELTTGREDRAVVITWMEQSGGRLRIVPERHTDAHAKVFSGFVL